MHRKDGECERILFIHLYHFIFCNSLNVEQHMVPAQRVLTQVDSLFLFVKLLFASLSISPKSKLMPTFNSWKTNLH